MKSLFTAQMAPKGHRQRGDWCTGKSSYEWIHFGRGTERVSLGLIGSGAGQVGPC